MKKIIYTVALMLSLSSCNFLETDIYDYLNEDNLYHTEESCLAGLSGVYDNLGANGAYGQCLWADLEAGTDIMVAYRTYNMSAIGLYNNNYNNTDTPLRQAWGDLYKGINSANDYIYLMEQRTAEECGGEVKKAMFLGEAKAVRALYYMNLVAFWGEVPLRTSVVRDLSVQKMKKASQPEIYTQIISDLEAAVAGCRPADELNAPGHVSKTAAEALLARACMWQAGYPVNAPTWEEALKHARNVKNSGLHKLWETGADGVNGYRALFINMCSNKYDLANRESMLEIEFAGNGFEQSNESGKVGLTVGVAQGLTSDLDTPYAFGMYNGTNYLFRLYGLENDVDQRKWWNFGDYCYVTVKNKAVETPLTATQKTNAKKFGANPGKWRAKYDPIRPWAKNNSSINYPVMRYSDVLLMIAECANEVNGGPNKEAIDAINEVRKRAGATLVELGTFTGKDDFRQFVFEERTRELCFEVPRRMELRRMGKKFYMDQIGQLKSTQPLPAPNGDVLKGYASDRAEAVAGLNLAEKHLYFPIPQTELNTNTICGQTENW